MPIAAWLVITRGVLAFASQQEPLGHGHAVYCARDFVGNESFLHLVGDHLYVNHGEKRCAQHLVDVAEAEACAVSAVQATRESLLPYYGTVGARRVAGHSSFYHIERVVEKPTPTQAEQNLIIPGLRAGHYLCFFGMHVLTPDDLRDSRIAGSRGPKRNTLSYRYLVFRPQHSLPARTIFSPRATGRSLRCRRKIWATHRPNCASHERPRSRRSVDDAPLAAGATRISRCRAIVQEGARHNHEDSKRRSFTKLFIFPSCTFKSS